MAGPRSRLGRRWLLEKCLHNASADIRAGAAAGLAELGDPHALSYLNKAIGREQLPALKGRMERARRRLEAMAGGA
jgi:hypothetical protein